MLSWDLIKIQLFNLDTTKLTSKTIATTLQAEANYHQRDKTSETAMLAAKKAIGSKGKSQTKDKSKGPKLDNECHYCHEKGHWISKCLKCEAEEKKTGAGTASLAINSLQDLGSGSSSSRYAEFIFMAGSIPDGGKLLLDLAVTSHMLLDHLLFMFYTPVTSCTPMTSFPLVTPRTFLSPDVVLSSLRHSYQMATTRSPSVMPSMSWN